MSSEFHHHLQECPADETGHTPAGVCQVEPKKSPNGGCTERPTGHEDPSNSGHQHHAPSSEDPSNGGHQHHAPSSEHSHHHHHGHSHGLPSSRGRLIGVLAITATIFGAEVIGAFWTGSLALLADAGHMLVDSSGLMIALGAALLMRRPRTDTHTWGYARAEVIAAAWQAGMLMIISLLVLVEVGHRLLHPTPVASLLMVGFGLVGGIGNAVSLLLLLSNRHQNLNLRAAFLEVLNDTLGSLAVIVAAALTWSTGWMFWDAVAGLLIALMMCPRALVLLRDSLGILMEQVPPGLAVEEIRHHILAVPHVIDVHDLHVSTIATGVHVLTAHVTVADECFHTGHAPKLLHQIQTCVSEHFPISIAHSTIQLDSQKHRDHEHLAHS